MPDEPKPTTETSLHTVDVDQQRIIANLQQQLTAEWNIRESEKKILIEEIEKNTQLRREIASLKENARVCDCLEYVGNLSPDCAEIIHDPNCPHCTNGVRFDAPKEPNVGLANYS